MKGLSEGLKPRGLQILLGYTSSIVGHVYLAMMIAGLPLAAYLAVAALLVVVGIVLAVDAQVEQREHHVAANGLPFSFVTYQHPI